MVGNAAAFLLAESAFCSIRHIVVRANYKINDTDSGIINISQSGIRYPQRKFSSNATVFSS